VAELTPEVQAASATTAKIHLRFTSSPMPRTNPVAASP
jgi:hypothetical protein